MACAWQAWNAGRGRPGRSHPRNRRKERSVHRWYGLDDVPGDWGASVVTIGVFDGVHLGHQRIVARAAEVAAEGAGTGQRLPVVVVTFDPHPDEVVGPGSHPPFLCTARRRAAARGTARGARGPRRLRPALHLRVLPARAG